MNNEHNNTDKFEIAKSYWLKKLKGNIEVVELQPDYDILNSYKVSDIKFVIPESTTSSLAKITKGNDLSQYIFLLSTLKVILGKYTNQEDIIVASPVYKFNKQEYNDCIALRSIVNSSATFKEFLLDVRETVIEGYKNQFYATYKVFELLGITNYKSFLKVALVDSNIHDLKLLDQIVQKYSNDLVLKIEKNEQATTLTLTLLYNSGIYSRTAMEQFLNRYVHVLDQVLGNPNIGLMEIGTLLVDEENKITKEFNNTTVNRKTFKTIPGLFSEQVLKSPNKIAVKAAIDIDDLYDNLKSSTIDYKLLEKYGKAYFKINPFVYKKEVPLNDPFNDVIVLKTPQHNSVVVNSTVHPILKLLTGKISLNNIFESIKGKQLNFLVISVNPDDVLEISNEFSKVDKISFNDRFENLVDLIKVFYANSLIDLVLYNPVEKELPLKIQNGFTENENLESADSAIEELTKPKKVEKADVLLLGDTPGLSTTGLLYIASYLKRNGKKVYCQFCDRSWDRELLEQNILNLLEEIRPKVVGISMKWFLHIARVLRISEIIKEFSSDIKVVVGGNTASYYWNDLIKYDSLDYIIRGDGEQPFLEIVNGIESAQNTVCKINDKIVESPITYIHNKENSSEIYLSNLEEVMLSKYGAIFGILFIYTQKGCVLNCIYCGGCNNAQKQTFNRSGLFVRPSKEVRKDIEEAKSFASTFKFLFDDFSNERLLKYCKEIWEGIELKSHYCFITNVIPPSKELVEYVNGKFKYVYWNLDLCSLSEPHRKRMFDMKLVKPQPTDSEILGMFDICERYENNEVIINLVNGLPFFFEEDTDHSKRVLETIMKKYTCFSELFWARLHAQPGAPMLENIEQYDMYSHALTFNDFLEISQKNFNGNNKYPNVDDFIYPYIYYNDDKLNSLITKFHIEINQKIKKFREDKRKKVEIFENITYAELEQESGKFAEYLLKNGVEKGNIIGLYIERSINMIVAMLGIMKSGAAYLPIDIDLPVSRISQMIEEYGVLTIVSETNLGDNALTIITENNKSKKNSSIEILKIDEILPLNANEPNNAFDYKCNPDDLAYIISTSGSTGRPKGVAIEHQSISNTLLWRKEYYKFDEFDINLQVPSYAFDSSVEDIFTPLICGAEILLIKNKNRFNLNYLEKLIVNEKVSHFLVVPHFYKKLLEEISESLKKLKAVTIAGESFIIQLVKQHFNIIPDVGLINEYGPTENSVCTTFYKFQSDSENVLIGVPINNVGCYILDNSGNLNGIGIPGELCISGKGLARGYINESELTNKKFSNDNALGEIIYHTGDKARWLNNGNLEFLGRIDNQAKIRGYRIELEEIENELNKKEGVKDSIVLINEPEGQGKRLEAYLVTERKGKESEIKKELMQVLPEYMVPSFIVTLDSLPFTVNGKVDKRELIKIGEEKNNKESIQVLPNNIIEKQIYDVWKEVLNKNEINTNESFFDIGGTSFDLIVLTSKLLENTGVEISPIDVFQYSTIKDLASYIKNLDNDSGKQEPTNETNYNSADSEDESLFEESTELFK